MRLCTALGKNSYMQGTGQPRRRNGLLGELQDIPLFWPSAYATLFWGIESAANHGQTPKCGTILLLSWWVVAGCWVLGIESDWEWDGFRRKFYSRGFKSFPKLLFAVIYHGFVCLLAGCLLGALAYQCCGKIVTAGNTVVEHFEEHHQASTSYVP